MPLARDHANRPRAAMLLLCGVVILVPGTGHAEWPTPGASPWQSIEQAQVQLIAARDAVAQDRELDVALHVRLDPGWHTYWRAAGGVGFPPQIDASGSANLARLEVSWPAPHRIESYGYEAIGYENEVVLPMRATLARRGAALALRVDLMIAVCSDICIPFQTTLALDVPAGTASVTPYAQLIARYAARVPAREDLSGFAIESVRLVRRGLGMTIEIAARADPSFDTPDLFIETRPGIVLGARDARAAGDGWFEVSLPFGLGSNDPLAEERVTVTLVDRTRAIERTLVLTARP